MNANTHGSLVNLAVSVKDDVIRWRRYLHQNPELAFNETATSQLVYDQLVEFGLLVSRPTETGIMARLIGDKPGATIAFRADMDALPIQEETGLKFASRREGVMHACGHDGHTAILLGVAKLLSGVSKRLSGELRFLFQPAEEVPPGGAEAMVEAGVLEGVEAVIGLHLQALGEVGLVELRPGPVQAAADTFEIMVEGQGGHAAYPHKVVDSIAVAVEIVSNLQYIVSRNMDPLDPAVLSVTRFNGGTADNVIPMAVTLGGTVRIFKPELSDMVAERMQRIAGSVASAHGAGAVVRYRKGYRPVVNDEGATQRVREALRGTLGEAAVLEARPIMAGEDFSAYQARVPGCFFYVGAGNEDKGITYPHHHPRFDIDEASLLVGVRSFLAIAEAYLS